MSSSVETACLDDNTIVEFIDGLLSPSEIASVESHAARCDSCRRLLAELGRSPTEAPHPGNLSSTMPAGGYAHIDLQAGQEIGRFVILSRIGKGGMGVVFSAYDPKLDRKVAIKLLHSRHEDSGQSPDDAQRRLMREAQAMAQLSHPNVIQVYDVGTYKSEVYIAMEFVQGETLSSWLLRWDRSWQDVLDKFVQAGKALTDAHGASLVHRDFKPDNVLVGEEGRVRVMDFGLARWVRVDESGHFSSIISIPPVASPIPALIAHPSATDDNDSAALGTADTQQPIAPSGQLPSDPALPLPTLPGDAKPQGKGAVALHHSLTKTGALLGTPRYMAPEQFTGANADARSDQFSFCVALYEALYQQHPFESNTSYGLVETPDTTDVRPPAVSSRVPAWLHRALLKGMSANPGERFHSMGALMRVLTPAPPKPPSSRRFFALVAIAIAAMIAAVYFYNVSDTTRDDLVAVEDENQQLELKISELQEDVGKLQTEVDQTLAELQKARVHEDRADELKQQLEKTSAKLAETLVQLQQTQKQLAKTARKLAIAKRKTRPVEPTRPRLRGLRKEQIEGQINKYYNDFETCLSEWSERHPNSDGQSSIFAVRFRIDSSGVPQRGSKTGGLNDKVVQQCIVGLLEGKRMRFPASDGITIAELGFSYRLGSLLVKVNVMDVVEDVASGQAEDSASDRPGADAPASN